MSRRDAKVLCAATVAMALAPPAVAQAVNTRVELNDGLRVTQLMEGQGGQGSLTTNHLLLRVEGPANAPTIIVGEGGQTVLEAGPGCSTMSANEVSCPNPNVGRLRIYTGRGNDSVDLSAVGGKSVPAEVHGGPGSDSIFGSDQPDTLFGDGDGGNGLPVTGPSAADTVSGRDILVGGPGNDTLIGGMFDDHLQGSTGLGGPATETNVLDGGHGDDVFELGLSPGADEVRAGEDGEETEDHANQPFGLEDVETKGDVATYERRAFNTPGTVGVTADLDATADDGGPGEGDLLGNVEAIVGSPRNDTLTGNGEGNLLIGKLGKDKLIGAAGDDRLDLVDGIADDCPDGGTGTNEIGADLMDQPVIQACTPPPASPPPPAGKKKPGRIVNELLFIPDDETTKPAVIGRRLKRRGTKLRVALRCPRSPQAACAGTLSIAPLKGGATVGRVAYRVPVKRTRGVSVPVGARGLAKLRRSGGVVLTLVHRGKSRKGDTTVQVVRRVPA